MPWTPAALHYMESTPGTSVFKVLDRPAEVLEPPLAAEAVGTREADAPTPASATEPAQPSVQPLTANEPADGGQAVALVEQAETLLKETRSLLEETASLLKERTEVLLEPPSAPEPVEAILPAPPTPEPAVESEPEAFEPEEVPEAAEEPAAPHAPGMAETEREPESESSPQRKLSLFGRKREAPKLEPEPHVAVPSEPAPPEPGFSKPDFVEPQPSSELLLPAASTPQAEPEALESEGEPVPSFDEPREALDDSLETLEARGPGETPILEKTSRKFPWRSRRRQETQDLAEGEALPEPEVREVLEELEEGPGSLERELRIDVAAPLAVEEEIEPEAIVEPAEPAAADETATEEAEAPMEAEPEAEPLAEPPPAPWRRRERPSLQKAMEAAVERSFFTPLDTEGEPQGAEAADAPIRLESVAPAEEEALEAPTLDEPRPAEGAQDRGWPWRRQRKQPSLAPAPEPDEAFAPPELVEPVEPPAPAPAPAAPQPTFPNLARPAASVTGSQDLLTAPPSPTEPSIEIPAPSPDRQGEPASAPQVASARPTPLPVAQPRFVGWVERPEGGVAAAREVIVPPARAPEPEAAAPVGAGKVPCSRCGQPSERGLCEACLDAIAELRQLSAQFGM